LCFDSNVIGIYYISDRDICVTTVKEERIFVFPSKQWLRKCTTVYHNYHALHVLRSAEPKLRKAIISNCNKELVNSISECILNVLNVNVKLTGCNTRKLRKHTVALRKVADKRVPLSTKKKLIVKRGGFLLPLLSTVLPAIASLIVSSK